MCLKQLLAYSTTCRCERLMKEMVTLVMGFSVSFETKGFILNITEHDFFVHVTYKRVCKANPTSGNKLFFAKVPEFPRLQKQFYRHIGLRC